MRVKLPHKLTGASTRQELLENILAIVDVMHAGIDGENLVTGALHAAGAVATNYAANANANLELIVACCTTNQPNIAQWVLEDHAGGVEPASFIVSATDWQADAILGTVKARGLRGWREGVGGALTFTTFPGGAVADNGVHRERIYTDQSPAGNPSEIGLDGLYATEGLANNNCSILFDHDGGTGAAAGTMCMCALVKRHLGR